MPPDWLRLIESGTPQEGLRFPAGHFHTAEELEEEAHEAGLAVERVIGVEGPAGVLLETISDASDEMQRAAYTIAEAASDRPGIRDFSQHLLLLGRVR